MILQTKRISANTQTAECKTNNQLSKRFSSHILIYSRDLTAVVAKITIFVKLRTLKRLRLVSSSSSSASAGAMLVALNALSGNARQPLCYIHINNCERDHIHHTPYHTYTLITKSCRDHAT